MPELTDNERTVLNNALSNLEVSNEIKDLPTNTPGEFADKWRYSSAQVDAFLEMRSRVALLPTGGSHDVELAETLASLDREITDTLSSLRTLSAYSGATNDEKIEHLKTIQALAGRHAAMEVMPQARQTALDIRNDLQSEIFTRQSPGFAELVVPPTDREYDGGLQSVELAIQARRNMGQFIREDAIAVLSREPDPGTVERIKEKTSELQDRHLQLTGSMKPTSLTRAQDEMNRIRMGTSDTIQGKSGGGELEGGVNQATQNWLEAAQRATEIAHSGLPLTLDNIRELNRILNKNMPANEGVPGEFRGKTETAGGGSQYPYPEHIPQMMEEFTRWFEENQHRDPIELAGLSYQKLVSIHPFDDANGRTCRLVVDSILQSRGLPPASYEGGEVNLAVFGVPQGGKVNMTPDEAIQIVANAVERSVGVMQKHSVTVSVREELGMDNPIESGPSLQQQQGLDEDLVPDLGPVPLTPPQRDEVERIRRDFAQIAISIDESTRELNKPNPLTKMATGGVKPDLSKFTDEELGVIYDQLVRSPSLNRLSDGFEENTNKWLGNPHRSCFTAISDRGVQTEDIPREELEEGIHDVLENYNYDLDPMIIAEAQNMTTNGRGAEIDGRMVNVMLSIEKLEEGLHRTADELQDVKDALPQSRLDAKAFARFTEQKMAANVQTGMRTKLEQFASRGNVPAAEVQEFFDSSRRRMDPSGMAGGNLHVAKMEKIQVDLKGMNFKGVDLSKADLSDFKIDAQTLSRAKGLNTVQGVDKETLDMAKHFQRIDRLEARLDKLSHPSFLDRLKSIPDGGVDKAREKLINMIDQTKLDFQRGLDQAALTQPQVGTSQSQTVLSQSQVGPSQSQGELSRSQLVPSSSRDEDHLAPKMPREELGSSQDDVESGISEPLGLDDETPERTRSVREQLGTSVGRSSSGPQTKVKVHTPPGL